LQNALQESFGKGLLISDKKQSKFRQWLLIAKTNAVYGLAQHLAEKNTVVRKLEALQKALQLPNPIQHIECFDVSHTKGEATVASCVVYGVDGPQNKNYRRFNIKDITPGDDYAALRQALLRRYTRLKEGDECLPDLLIIDGGKGQLRQAIEVLEELQVSGVELLGVAKGVTRKPGLETLILAGKDTPIYLSNDDIALHLIQYIRDESHRFAIMAHRAKRDKARVQSPLEFIEGVGAKRRRDLLRHFGGLQELRRASIDDIAKVSGISLVLAERIYEVLH
jgi:excinuclease ABC subunit C